MQASISAPGKAKRFMMSFSFVEGLEAEGGSGSLTNEPRPARDDWPVGTRTTAAWGAHAESRSMAADVEATRGKRRLQRETSSPWQPVIKSRGTGFA